MARIEVVNKEGKKLGLIDDEAGEVTLTEEWKKKRKKKTKESRVDGNSNSNG